jgi:hypothetical protein
MIQIGDKVIQIRTGMPGEVVDFTLGDPVIAWEEGYDSDCSGWTLSCPLSWVGTHVLLVGENGRKPNVPASLIDPSGRDLFDEAMRLSFELAS